MALPTYVDFIKWVGRMLHDGSIGLIEQSAAPGTPPANQATFYCRDKGNVATLFWKDDAGKEHDLSDLINSGVQAALGLAFSMEREGEQGEQGISGLPGTQGLVGLPGRPGKDGEDAEDNWVPGPQGLTGPQGIQGYSGVPGLDGQDGEDSMQPGPVGATGAAGLTQAQVLLTTLFR